MRLKSVLSQVRRLEGYYLQNMAFGLAKRKDTQIKGHFHDCSLFEGLLNFHCVELIELWLPSQAAWTVDTL